MSLPRAQITGAAAEAAVELLFLSWGWNVGHDRIDEGYDLHVTPDRAIYKGFHFSVQVKGTSQKKAKGSITAQVSKSRLKQYAEDFSPVFIVRATADGSLYWVHAQTWAQANKHRLRDTGYGGVRFNITHDLRDRASFEGYLFSVFQSPPYVSAISSDSLHEAFYLNTLDPRLTVKIKDNGKGKIHEIFAKHESVSSDLSFTPVASVENINNLKEAIEFGLPRAVQVEGFSITGSPLLEHILKGPVKGDLSINSVSVQPVKLRMFPGRKFSVTSGILSLKAERFIGNKGVIFTNERMESYIDISIRFSHEQSQFKATANIQLRDLGSNGTPAREIDFLRELGLWADQVIKQDSFSIEISILGVQLPIFFSQSTSENIWNFVYLADAIRKIHLIAKATSSNIVLPTDFEITPTEIDEIELAYLLLKGDSKDICIESLEVTPKADFDFEHYQGGDFFCTTTLRIELFGQILCELPISVQLIDFQLDKIPASSRIKFIQGERGVARASYAESFDSKNPQLAGTFGVE